MEYNRKRRPCSLFILPATIALLLTLSWCHSNRNPVRRNESTFTELQEATLQSFQQIDDYPLYTMSYHGDYGFANYLKTGSVPLSYNETNTPDNSNAACTCYLAGGNIERMLFGRNFDFHHGPTLLLYTDPPNGYASVSMVDIFYCGYEETTPLTTTEERADLLQAPYLPMDGMNEHGVAMGVLAVPSAVPPYDPGKLTLHDLAMIRLVLDYAKTTEEAIQLVQQYNITMTEIPVHFFIGDATGESAVIEYVDGKLEVTRSVTQYQVVTNFVIASALPNLSGKCWRYDIVNDALRSSMGNTTFEGGMRLLEDVSQESTMWSLVYDLSSLEFVIAMGKKIRQPD